MPKNKRLESSEDSSSDSGPDDPTPTPPPKKQAKSEPPPKSSKSSSSSSGAKSKGKSSDDGDDKRFQLDRNRYITVRDFRGKVLIDIREYYTTADGEERPGKKGISLNATQWSKLKSLIEDVDSAVADF
ncbi:unnamed protein product [Allacma fusca]|uniref:Transcriptional coactivator p15 (PC4) C-terminal domain-containing protein n=1 Tax=Allacma fusca TaxID=39272 RepID=A0A8J2LH46_9HEXA|nr:unnamed protein product [Allacma fusca]